MISATGPRRPQVPTAIAQNGIQVSYGAGATISGSTVTGNECNDTAGGCGPDGFTQVQSGGILVFDRSPTTVSSTTFSGHDIGPDAKRPSHHTTTARAVLDVPGCAAVLRAHRAVWPFCGHGGRVAGFARVPHRLAGPGSRGSIGREAHTGRPATGLSMVNYSL